MESIDNLCTVSVYVLCQILGNIIPRNAYRMSTKPVEVMNDTSRYTIILTLLIVIACFACYDNLSAQCDSDVPSFEVDLSTDPAGTWTSVPVVRNGFCCGASGSSKCLEFIVTLHPNSVGLIFDVCSGAVPGGALYYQVGCGPQNQVGEELCLSGSGPYLITFCKPGNNLNEYCITSVSGPAVGPDVNVNEGCSDELTATGFLEPSLSWNSIYPGAAGEYNSILSCSSSCDTVQLVAMAGLPETVLVEVCGTIDNTCITNQICKVITVNFNSSLTGQFNPESPMICYGETTTTVSALGSGGTPPYSYIWSTGDTTQDVEVTDGDYSVIVSDASNCSPYTMDVSVSTATEPISVLVMNDTTICADNIPIALTAQLTGVTTGVWIGAQGVFSPSPEDLTCTYLPTENEIGLGGVTMQFIATGTGDCPVDTAELDLTLSTFDAVISLDIDSTNCFGGTDGAIAVNLSGGNAPFSLDWTPSISSGGTTISGLESGDYEVVISDKFGCDTLLTITVHEPPVLAIAALSVDSVSCYGGEDGQAYIVCGGGQPQYDYSWNGPSGSGDNQLFENLSAGDYSVTVMDLAGCGVDTSFTIYENEALELSLVNIQNSSCSGLSNGSISVIASGGMSPFSYLWDTDANAQTTSEASSLGNGTYSVTVTDNNQCVESLSASIIQMTPDSITHEITICEGDLYYEQTSGYTTTGIYADTYINIHGCDSVVTTDLTVHPIEAVTNEVEICSGDTYFEQTSVYTSSGTYTNMYQSIHGCDSVVTTDLTVHPSEAVTNEVEICSGDTYYEQSSAYASSGIYTDTYQSIHGCDSVVTTDLTVRLPLTLEVVDNQTSCPGSELIIWAIATGGSGSPFTYFWEDIGEGQELSVTPEVNTTYTVIASDSYGCQSPSVSTSIETIRMDDDVVEVTASETTICGGESSILQGVHTGPQSTYFFEWNEVLPNELGPHQVSPVSDTWYVLTVSDTCSNSLQDSILLTILESPELELQAIEELGCVPYEVEFQQDGNHPVETTFSWNFGNGDTSIDESPTYSYNDVGEFSYSLAINYPNGCTLLSQDIGQVQVAPLPVSDFSASSLFVDDLNPTVQFTSLSSNDAMFYDWDFGQSEGSFDQNPSVDFHEEGTFLVSLLVENEYGCADMASSHIQSTSLHEIIIPNAFTPDPNGSSDGEYNINALDNNIFFPWTDHVSRFEMLIYNRWGELIFRSTDISHGWNGMYLGQMSQQDVYIYRIMITYEDGEKADRVGNITLYR